jgi:hypothetical protein
MDKASKTKTKTKKKTQAKLLPGHSVVMARRVFDTPITVKGGTMSFMVEIAPESMQVKFETDVVDALAAVGDSLLSSVCDKTPAHEGRFSSLNQSGEFRGDSVLAHQMVLWGAKRIDTGITKVARAFCNKFIKTRSKAEMQVTARVGLVPAWTLECATIVFVFVLEDGGDTEIKALLSVHHSRIKLGRAIACLRSFGHTKFGDLVQSRDMFLDTPDTTPKVASALKPLAAEFSLLAKNTVLRNSFCSAEQYAAALRTDIEPVDLPENMRWARLLTDFSIDFLDPSHKALDTPLSEAWDPDVLGNTFLSLLDDFVEGRPPSSASETSAVSASLGLFPATVAIPGAPLVRDLMVECDPYVPNSSFMFTVVFPQISFATMAKTFERVARTCEELLEIRTGRNNNSHSDLGDNPVVTFMMSDSALCLQRVAEAEQSARKLGSPLFQIRTEDGKLYNEIIKAVPTLSLYSPDDILLVTVDGGEGDLVVVMRNMIFQLYKKFQQTFTDVPIPDDEETPPPCFTIVDSMGRLAYFRIPHVIGPDQSVIVAPDAEVAVALSLVLPQIPIYVHNEGRFVFTDHPADWRLLIRNVVFVAGHLWDSIDFCQTSLALRAAFPAAKMWIFGDSHALPEAIAARRRWVSGSIYHHLFKEAVAVAKGHEMGKLADVVPRAQMYNGAAFPDFHNDPSPPMGTPVDLFSSVALLKNNALVEHCAPLLFSRQILKEAASFDFIRSVGLTAFQNGPASGGSLPFSMDNMGLSWIVVVDGPSPISDYKASVRRHVEALEDGDPVDLVKPGTILRCSQTRALFRVTHVLSSSGDIHDPVPLSTTSRDVGIKVIPVRTRRTQRARDMADMEAVICFNHVRPLCDAFEIATVVSVDDVPTAIDVVFFVSCAIEETFRPSTLAWTERGVHAPDPDSANGKEMEESCFRETTDNERLLGVIPDPVLETILRAARHAVILGYRDGNTSKLTPSSWATDDFAEEDLSQMFMVHETALLVDPLSKIKANTEARTLEGGTHDSLCASIPKLSDIAWNVVGAALQQRYGKRGGYGDDDEGEDLDMVESISDDEELEEEDEQFVVDGDEVEDGDFVLGSDDDDDPLSVPPPPALPTLPESPAPRPPLSLSISQSDSDGEEEDVNIDDALFGSISGDDI